MSSKKPEAEPATQAAREEFANFNEELENAQNTLEVFQAENSGNLEAIQEEFEDFEEHPLWQSKKKNERKIRKVKSEHDDWWTSWDDEKDQARDNIGWSADIVAPVAEIYTGRGRRHGGEHKYIKRQSPHENYDEFLRRADIADSIGEVAAMLHEFDGEPIVGIASYSKPLYFKTSQEIHDKLEGKGKDYQAGEISTWKIRAQVGKISQPKSEPILMHDRADKEQSGGDILPVRMELADTTGIIGAYSLPEIARFEQQVRTQAPHTTRAGLREIKKKKSMPWGNSLDEDIPFKEFYDEGSSIKDLVVIDGPHKTAKDLKVDGAIIHRPKQRVEGKEPLTQEVAILPRDNEQNDHALFFGDNDQMLSIPAPRHGSIWLVGNKAIQQFFKSGLVTEIPAISSWRGTGEVIFEATSDLVKQSRSRK